MSQIAETIAVELPLSIYRELATMASKQQSNPVQMISNWVRAFRQRKEWQQGWAELCRQVEQDPPDWAITDGEAITTEAIVEQMRATRQEIFEAEYAHLYR